MNLYIVIIYLYLKLYNSKHCVNICEKQLVLFDKLYMIIRIYAYLINHVISSHLIGENTNFALLCISSVKGLNPPVRTHVVDIIWNPVPVNWF